MGTADSKYIDLTTGLTRVANNETLYRTLVGKFATSVDMSGFDAAISAKDYTTAGEIVHAAKGIAGNLALNAFFESSVVLMTQLRGGNAPKQENVDEFRLLYGETVDAIKDYLG